MGLVFLFTPSASKLNLRGIVKHQSQNINERRCWDSIRKMHILHQKTQSSPETRNKSGEVIIMKRKWKVIKSEWIEVTSVRIKKYLSGRRMIHGTFRRGTSPILYQIWKWTKSFWAPSTKIKTLGPHRPHHILYIVIILEWEINFILNSRFLY